MGKLGIYLVANYPSKSRFLDAVKACHDHGVDFLEVGLPFTDPVADGEVIEKAAQESLKRYTSKDLFDGFRQARAIFKKKVYIMTYANLIYSAGITRFMDQTGPFDGLILADLPLREIPHFERHVTGHRTNLIRFLTPESRPEDIASALKGAKDFVYFVSKRGTTGGSFQLDDETKVKISQVRGKGVDVYLGFGIQDRGDLSTAYAAAEGAIIGTRAVHEIGAGVDRFKKYLGSLRE